MADSLFPGGKAPVRKTGCLQPKAIQSPKNIRSRVDYLLGKKEAWEGEQRRTSTLLAECENYLQTSAKVSTVLEQLSEELFKKTLREIEVQLTILLQEVLGQPIQLRTSAEWKHKSATVEFWIERDEHREDIIKGQGGSVINILSTGLRMVALSKLDESEHRRFLVLDEQDAWLSPKLVPKFVNVVHEVGKALGFQILMISHHKVAKFKEYADRIYRLYPTKNNEVDVEQITCILPQEKDQEDEECEKSLL